MQAKEERQTAAKIMDKPPSHTRARGSDTTKAVSNGLLQTDGGQWPGLRPVRTREVEDSWADADSSKINETSLAASAVDKQVPAATNAVAKQPPTAFPAVTKQPPTAAASVRKQPPSASTAVTKQPPTASNQSQPAEQQPPMTGAAQQGARKGRKLVTPNPLPPSPTHAAQETSKEEQEQNELQLSTWPLQNRPRADAGKPGEKAGQPDQHPSYTMARRQQHPRIPYQPPIYKTSQQAHNVQPPVRAADRKPAAATSVTGSGSRAAAVVASSTAGEDLQTATAIAAHMTGVQTLWICAGTKNGPLLGGSTAEIPEADTILWVSAGKESPKAASWTACCSQLPILMEDLDIQDQASDCLSECAVAGSITSSINPLDFLLGAAADAPGTDEPEEASGAGSLGSSPASKTSSAASLAQRRRADSHKALSPSIQASAPLTAESVRMLNADITATGVQVWSFLTCMEKE